MQSLWRCQTHIVLSKVGYRYRNGRVVLGILLMSSMWWKLSFGAMKSEAETARCKFPSIIICSNRKYIHEPFVGVLFECVCQSCLLCIYNSWMLKRPKHLRNDGNSIFAPPRVRFGEDIIIIIYCRSISLASLADWIVGCESERSGGKTIGEAKRYQTYLK